MLRSIFQRSMKPSTSVAPIFSFAASSSVALKCAFREFHHKPAEESSKPIEFDNGKKVEKWSFFGGGTHDPPSGGPSSFMSFPSALETEAHLPTAQQLYESIPSAAEAERRAMASQQTSEDETEHKDEEE